MAELTNDLPIIKASLDCVIPTRTLSRTLTTKGRESILNRFRQRRSVQRNALIDHVLEGLKQEEVKAVHESNRPRKEYEISQIDHLREIWKGQAQWFAKNTWPLAPESREGAWQDKIMC